MPANKLLSESDFIGPAAGEFEMLSMFNIKGISVFQEDQSDKELAGE
jgi:hypothetical protein